MGDEARRDGLTEGAAGWVRTVEVPSRAAEAAGMLRGCSVESMVGGQWGEGKFSRDTVVALGEEGQEGVFWERR